MHFFLATLIALSPAVAFAHPDHTGHDAGGFASGLVHPILGPDHLAAMVAVGLWAAVNGGRALWAAPMAFLGAMLLAGLAVSGGAEVGMVEHVIIASIIVLGLGTALMVSLPLAAALALIAVFGLAHGYAHGLEGTGQPGYVVGFLLATATLHGLGIALGRVALGYGTLLVRLVGVGIALAGSAMAVA